MFEQYLMTRRPEMIGCGFLRATVLVCLLAGAGCMGLSGGDGASDSPARSLPSSDGLLGSPELQGVVDLQVQRNGAALTRLLSSPEAAIRARAALALGSVQDQGALDALVGRLDDEDPVVRRHAAFAIGQLALADGGGVLVEALGGESDPAVRRALIEAIGKRGGIVALEGLMATEPLESDEPVWTLALATAALREVRPPGLVDRLVERLSHEDPEIRLRAAYYFGRTPNVSAWTDVATAVRGRLDTLERADPTAMHLVSALGRLAEVEEDASRLADWILTGGDWRTRVNAAAAVRTPLWLESESIRAAMLAALDDPSGHVRTTAAESLALLMWSSDDMFARGVEWLQGPPELWRVQLAFLSPLASQAELPLVLDWIRRMAEVEPVAAAEGLQVVGGFPPASVTELLFELSDHPDSRVRSTAVAELAGRMPVEGSPEDLRPYYDLFGRIVLEPERLPAARAAAALAHPAMQSFGADELVEEAFLTRRDEGDVNVLIPLLDAMGLESVDLLRDVIENEDLRLRQAAARTVERLTGTQVPTAREGLPEPEIDWSYLAEVGRAPRVRVVTDHGAMTIRLFTEQAPLTVQAFVRNVESGAYDGTYFHRVVPNFVIQGGDFALGDGTGDAGYRLRSELTELSFERGVIGMASSGKDTEGSQFYLTHSLQPHLNGGYTSFGWIEEGRDVLDLLQQGDRVLSMELEPDEE